MSKTKNTITLLLVWALPALLLLLTRIILGCYYESNDDVAISQVIRGETALAPVTNMHLYFHGLSYLLARLYHLLPSFPWYGVLLYLLLYGSLVLVYQTLVDLLASYLSLLGLTTCLIAIYWFAWQETALLMNYTRLPLLLAGTGILYAASRRDSRWSLLLALLVVAIGWAIRPSAAILGLVVALPGAWWLAGFQAAVPITSAVALMAIATGIMSANYSAIEKSYRQVDIQLVSYSDYQLYQPRPLSVADSLGLLSVDNWALGDSTLVNERLFKHSLQFDQAVFLHHTLPRKARASYYMLREYYQWLILFPVLLGVWLLLQNPWREHGEFWAAQVAFTALLLFLIAFLKLPQRLASPLFSIWTVNSLLYVMQRSPGLLRFSRAWQWILCLAFLLTSVKVWRQSRMYHQRQTQNEAYMSQVYAVAKHHILVAGGVEWAYIYLSPFKTYELSDSPVVTLMGWLALEPSLPPLRKHLTGTRDFEESLNRLATNPSAIWIMQDAFALYLRVYAQRHRLSSTSKLYPVYQRSLSPNREFASLYRVQLRTRRATR
ncbi:hypothetical protein [Hymenobacter volaticus]|uniref:Glycosyltransferase RgtA/B/C/D-like domain-containing protein n=1 Tax=Hymenobacter volaticus TaxID=2932254 RepID=A0ABY4G0V5_9BACT|nr:hypothetical protein [Hymenobacter volaticus]UOQ64415.1 hypothetical protein MUN86_12520 [Hymenobacter volaticus]